MRGLFGSADKNPANDVMTADGTVVTDPHDAAQLFPGFANSWRVTEQTSLFTYPQGADTGTYTDRTYPAIPSPQPTCPTPLRPNAAAAPPVCTCNPSSTTA